MPTPTKKKATKSTAKKKVTIKTKVGVRKRQASKDTIRVDSLRKAATKIPDNGATIKIKVKKKKK